MILVKSGKEAPQEEEKNCYGEQMIIAIPYGIVPYTFFDLFILNEYVHCLIQGCGSAFHADPDPDPVFFLIADPDSGSGFRIRIQVLMN
jgi:hypothetical protein